MHASTITRYKGFTLIEIMIALMLGIIVIGGALSIYISTIRGSANISNSARLNYDLDAVMQLMKNDIRRAGYWGGAISGSDATTNPFTSIAANNIQLLVPDAGDATKSNCILYTYDSDGNSTPDNGEFYGFKLDNGTIRISSKDSIDDSGNCTKANYWEDFLESSQVNISTLTFSAANSKCLNISTGEVFPGTCALAIAAAGGVTGKVSSGNKAVETRQIDITLTGNIIGDISVKKTLQSIVKIRNNRIFNQP